MDDGNDKELAENIMSHKELHEKSALASNHWYLLTDPVFISGCSIPVDHPLAKYCV